MKYNYMNYMVQKQKRNWKCMWSSKRWSF